MMQKFQDLRSCLEKQYAEALYVPESGWTEERLWTEYEKHCCENPAEPRILARAFLSSLILEHGPVALEKENPFAGKVQSFGLPWRDVSLWEERTKQIVPGYEACAVDYALGIRYCVDKSHVCPDWKRVLELGIPGLIARAKQGTSPLHKAVEMVYTSLAVFCRRAAALNENETLAAIADHAPRTLREAFHLAAIVHDAIELFNEEVRTMGRFDSLYIDFYRRDLNEGRLTRDSARELIKFWWILFYARYEGKRFGKNFCFGPDFNELSYLGMETYYELNTPDPKLSVLVRDSIPQDFLELYARCIRDGRTSIVSLNYQVIVEGLVKHGRSREDAEHVIPIGCYEPAVEGKEVSLSGQTSLFLPQIMLNALNSREDFVTFEEFKQTYYDFLQQTCRILARHCTLCNQAWPWINPVPLLSGTFDSCMEKGKDVSEGGAVYNTSGCVISYIADAVDSLAAVKYLCFDEKRLTIPQLQGILRTNWDGQETLRHDVMQNAPKWGNNDDRVDQYAREISHLVSQTLSKLPNGRGGTMFPSLYGQMVVEYGEHFGAFPSGRKAGDPVSKNMDAAIAMDRNGITALMDSVLKVDMTEQPCGTCLDLMLHPTSVRGDEGVKLLAQIIRTFIRNGGSGIQFNIFDAAVLRDAQAHPEKYSNLQVRVCGWNVRFNDLSPAAQETFIRQAEVL